MDASTGVLLVAAPETTLRLFGATMPGGGGDILMRYVGAFVLGVGLAYLWALGWRPASRRGARLHGVWGATTAIRACVAVFTLAAVALGHLEPAWLVVTASDATLAMLQGWGLTAGWLNDA